MAYYLKGLKVDEVNVKNIPKGQIGLVTLYQNNYGSALQCYATKKYLEQQGYKCDLLYEYNKGLARVKGDLFRIGRVVIFSLFSKEYRINRKQIKANAAITEKRMSSGSKRALDYFSKTVLQPKGVDCFLLHERQFLEKYAYFITGSDQVWNGANLVSPFRFLSFAPNSKKIALSPSFGVDKIKNFNIRSFKKNIATFTHLSVREKSGVNIIRELTGKEVQRLGDPVVLLNDKEWVEFSKSGVKNNRPYIFVHFLDSPSSNALKAINYVIEKYKYDVICFANPYKEYEQFKYNFIEGGPEDYVSLISGARIVCTDSFHSSYFSIMFNVPFYVFERNYNHENKQSTRLDNLLEIYKCRERFIRDDCNIISGLSCSPVDFDDIRIKERENLISYLNNCLVFKQERIEPPLLKEETSCTGCAACVSICPVKAITFRRSDFGYKLPQVDISKCVQCGLCERTCREEALVKRIKSPEAYIAYNTNEYDRLNSASGGTFSGLAKAFINNGGVVCGCELSFSDGLPVVKHILVDTVKDIGRILGSKYVESDCSDIYKQISDLLGRGKKVLFCGTSCQVKSVCNYLDIKTINRTNFYTIDLVCHGVPGIDLFRDYIKHISHQYNGLCIDFKFRGKYNSAIHYEEHVSLIKNGCQIDIVIPSNKSAYYQMFLRYEGYRESCYHCEYASIEKPADITLGDYFEAREDYPHFFQRDGALESVDYYNAVIVHSEKGNQLFALAQDSVNILEVEANKVQYSHRQLCIPPNYSYLRLKIFEAYKRKGFRGIERVFIRERIVRSMFPRKVFSQKSK